LSEAASARDDKFSLKKQSLELDLPRLRALRRELIPMNLDGASKILAYTTHFARPDFFEKQGHTGTSKHATRQSQATKSPEKKSQNNVAQPTHTQPVTIPAQVSCSSS
jgi:hypothetical protein